MTPRSQHPPPSTGNNLLMKSPDKVMYWGRKEENEVVWVVIVRSFGGRRIEVVGVFPYHRHLYLHRDGDLVGHHYHRHSRPHYRHLSPGIFVHKQIPSHGKHRIATCLFACPRHEENVNYSDSNFEKIGAYQRDSPKIDWHKISLNFV